MECRVFVRRQGRFAVCLRHSLLLLAFDPVHPSASPALIASARALPFALCPVEAEFHEDSLWIKVRAYLLTQRPPFVRNGLQFEQVRDGFALGRLFGLSRVLYRTDRCIRRV